MNDDDRGKHDFESPEPGDTAVDECDNCGYETQLTCYRGTHPATDRHWFCEVCASSYLSHATVYRSQCQDPRLHRSLGWIANRILDEIRGLKFVAEDFGPGAHPPD